MKKFFKGLALVLALVLVLGTIPASNASAKVATSKKLYLNGGTAKKNTAKLYKLAGVKKADAAKVTAESSDSKIVKAGTKKLTAKAEGEAEVKVMVDGKLVTTVKVTVKDLAKPAEVELKAQSVTQTASNAIQVVFNKEVADLEKTDFDLYYMAGDAKVKGFVVSSAKQNADNKNAWDVVFFSSFEPKTQYTVVAKDVELNFTAAGNTYKDVASVKISGDANVVVSTLSKAYSVKYYNAAGMDITSTVDASKFTITFSADDIKDGYFSGNQIYFWTIGATATVKVKVEQFNEKFELVTVAEDAMAVTCVAAAQKTYAGINCWSFTNGATSLIGKNYSKCNYNLAVGDSREFQVVINTLTGTEKGTEQLFASTTDGYRFESADPTIAIVTGVQTIGGKDQPVVYGVKEGTTYIKIFAYKPAQKIDSLITAVEIQVKAARKASAVAVEWSQNTLNLDQADTAKLTLKVTDQYGDPINTKKAIKIKSAQSYLDNLGGFNDITVPGTTTTGKYEITFGYSQTALTYVKDGVYTGTITADDATVGTTLSVAKKSDATKINGYKLGDLKSFDVALTNKTKDVTDNTIVLKSYVDGYYMETITMAMVDKAPQPATGGADGFVYTVVKNGSYVKRADGIVLNCDSDPSVLAPSIDTFITASTAVTKAAVATYVVTAYQVKSDATDLGKCSVQAVDTKTFAITDGQLKPSFTQVKGKVAISGANDVTAFKAAFLPTFNGKSYDTWADATADGYDVTAVNAKWDAVNKTLSVISATFTITNKNESSPDDSLKNTVFTITNVPVTGIVYAE